MRVIPVLFLLTIVVSMGTGALLFGLGFASGARWQREQREEIDQLTQRRW